MAEQVQVLSEKHRTRLYDIELELSEMANEYESNSRPRLNLFRCVGALMHTTDGKRFIVQAQQTDPVPYEVDARQGI